MTSTLCVVAFNHSFIFYSKIRLVQALMFQCFLFRLGSGAFPIEGKLVHRLFKFSKTWESSFQYFWFISSKLANRTVHALNGNPFSCPNCFQSFATVQGLLSHSRHRHRLNETPVKNKNLFDCKGWSKSIRKPAPSVPLPSSVPQQHPSPPPKLPLVPQNPSNWPIANSPLASNVPTANSFSPVDVPAPPFFHQPPAPNGPQSIPPQYLDSDDEKPDELDEVNRDFIGPLPESMNRDPNPKPKNPAPNPKPNNPAPNSERSNLQSLPPIDLVLDVEIPENSNTLTPEYRETFMKHFTKLCEENPTRSTTKKAYAESNWLQVRRFQK